MLLLPQRLLNQPFIQTYWSDGQSYLLRKEMAESTGERHGYLSCHALSFVQQGQQRIISYEGANMSIEAGEVGLLPKGLYTITDLIAEGGMFETILFFYHDNWIASQIQDRINEQIGNQIQNGSTGFWKRSIPPFAQAICDQLKQRTTPSDLLERIEGKQLLQRVWQLLSQEDDIQNSPLIQLLEARQKPKISLPQFMEEHYDKPLSIEDYAYLTGRSLSTFHREFKRRFDSSPRQWIRDKRLEKSVQLLSEEGASVTDAVYAVGYQHVSNFIKAFKAKYQLTPKQFVLQHRSSP